MPEVTLNGSQYFVRGEVEEYQVKAITEPFRLSGIETREDNQRVKRFVYDTHAEMGIGWRRMRRSSPPRGIGGIWKSTAETRFPDCITNQLKEHEQTHATPLDWLRGYLGFAGSYGAAFESDYASGKQDGGFYDTFNPSTDTWGPADLPGYNATSSGNENSPATTVTVSHTVQSTYGNRAVVAFVTVFDAVERTPSGVTYNSVTMTQVGSTVTFTDADGLVDLSVSIWRLVAPATGSNNCVATFSTDVSEMNMGVSDFYFVNQTTPFGTSGSATGTSTSPSKAITTRRGDLVVSVLGTVQSEDITAGTGETLDYEEDLTDVGGGGLRERATGTSTTTAPTLDSSADWALLCAPLQASQGVVNFGTTNAEGARIFDVTQHKGRVIAVGSKGSGAETQFEWFHSADGDAFTPGAGTGWPTTAFLTTTVTRRNNWDDRHALVLDDKLALVIVLFEDSASSGGSVNQARVYRSTNNGSDWTNIVNVPTAYPPRGLFSFFDPFDQNHLAAPVLVLAEGAYIIDVPNTTAKLLYPMSGHEDDAKSCGMDDRGALWVSTQNGDHLAILVSSTGLTIEAVSIGPVTAKLDGLPTEWRGHGNMLMTGSTPGSFPTSWAFVAFGGHAGSKTATIMAYDYDLSTREKPVWHCVHDAQENGISGMGQNVDISRLGLSSLTDGVPRLFAAAEGSAGSLMFHFEEPLVCHPSSEITGNYQEDSQIDYAEDDMGDPAQSSALLLARLLAEELGTATDQEYVDHKYAADAADWGDADNGDFTSAVSALKVNSGNGVAMGTVKHTLILNRRAGTVTERVVIKDFEFQCATRQAYLRGYFMVIDLKRSGLIGKHRSIKQVVANLETAIKSVPRVNFKYADIPLLQVEVLREAPGQSILGEGQAHLNQQRSSGVYLIRVEETQEA